MSDWLFSALCASGTSKPTRRAYADSVLETPRSAPEASQSAEVQYATPCRRFKYVDGKVAFTFGRHEDETVERVVQTDTSYLKWMRDEVSLGKLLME